MSKSKLNKKEIYENVRKAYRLLTEVQESVAGIIKHIESKLHNTQIFCNTNNYNTYQLCTPAYYDPLKGWSWESFPPLIHIFSYYSKDLSFKPSEKDIDNSRETSRKVFSIVQIMDDGFIIDNASISLPRTNKFTPPEDSHSYLMMVYWVESWKDKEYTPNLDFKVIGKIITKNEDQYKNARKGLSTVIKKINSFDKTQKTDDETAFLTINKLPEIINPTFKISQVNNEENFMFVKLINLSSIDKDNIDRDFEEFINVINNGLEE